MESKYTDQIYGATMPNRYSPDHRPDQTRHVAGTAFLVGFGDEERIYTHCEAQGCLWKSEALPVTDEARAELHRLGHKHADEANAGLKLSSHNQPPFSKDLSWNGG